MPAAIKYISWIIGAASLLIALYSKVSAGRWRTMSTLDWVATVLTVTGFGFGIYLAREQSITSQREAFDAAVLTDLTLEWTLDNVPAPARRSVPLAACPSPDDERRHPERREQLYPFLTALEGGRSSARTVLLLLSLDADAGHVLPLGLLDSGAKKLDDADLSWIDTTPESLAKAAATVDLVEDLDECIDRTVRRGHPLPSRRPRTCEMMTTLSAAGDRVTLRWDLNRECVSAGVDRRDGTDPKMKLPDRLTLLLLTGIGDLPFDPANFTKDGGLLQWRKQTVPVRDYRARSELHLESRSADGGLKDEATYVMQAHQKFLMVGKGGGAEVPHEYPTVTRWTGERSPK